jgi:pimeloyl-[acyl-carrier protein] synthase
MFDFDAPELIADPYPAYRQMRETDPVYRSEYGDWYVTRHEDVALVLGDKRFGLTPAEGSHILGYPARAESVFDAMIAKWMVFRDPPGHTRLRRLVAGWASRQRVEALTPAIQTITDGLLDRMHKSDAMDIVSDFAYPLPVMVIAHMLGSPEEDHGLFRDASRQFSEALNVCSDENSLACETPALMMMDYFHDLVSDRAKQPRDDLISAMVAESETGGGIHKDEILATCVFLLWAGHETTKNLISGALLTLLRNPAQKDALLLDPDLLPSAIEELLRFESPIQRVCRWTLAPVDIGGVRIDEGQLVVAMIGAANRDPARFPDPERLDLARNDNGHFAFGRGAHHCIGNLLARIEARIAIGSILQRMPDLAEGPGQMEWQATSFVRGPAVLPVHIRQ